MVNEVNISISLFCYTQYLHCTTECRLGTSRKANAQVCHSWRKSL